MLRLEFSQELDDTDRLGTLSLLSTGFQYIWQSRVEKKAVSAQKMRSDLEASISILRKTRFSSSADKMLEIII